MSAKRSEFRLPQLKSSGGTLHKDVYLATNRFWEPKVTCRSRSRKQLNRLIMVGGRPILLPDPVKSARFLKKHPEPKSSRKTGHLNKAYRPR